jgi:hypothetical protein
MALRQQNDCLKLLLIGDSGVGKVRGKAVFRRWFACPSVAHNTSTRTNPKPQRHASSEPFSSFVL